MKAKECLRELQRMDVEIKAMREQISVLENEAEGVQALRYSDFDQSASLSSHPSGGSSRSATSTSSTSARHCIFRSVGTFPVS